MEGWDICPLALPTISWWLPVVSPAKALHILLKKMTGDFPWLPTSEDERLMGCIVGGAYPGFPEQHHQHVLTRVTSPSTNGVQLKSSPSWSSGPLVATLWVFSHFWTPALRNPTMFLMISKPVLDLCFWRDPGPWRCRPCDFQLLWVRLKQAGVTPFS